MANTQRAWTHEALPASAPIRRHYQRKVERRFHTSPRQVVTYGVLAAAFLFGLFQTGRCLVDSTMKLVVMNSHQTVVDRLYKSSLNENKSLQSRIRRYQSADGLEELARNKLEWVGEGEVLVRTQ
jgi:cell division protein FtsB